MTEFLRGILYLEILTEEILGWKYPGNHTRLKPRKKVWEFSYLRTTSLSNSARASLLTEAWEERASSFCTWVATVQRFCTYPGEILSVFTISCTASGAGRTPSAVEI